MSRRLVISIDVEAQPFRAEKDHVSRLIWGNFDGRESGLAEMMQIAQSFDAKLTCFLDYCETLVHGDAITEVGRRIVAQGHDLQLHTHPELLPHSFWQDSALPPIERWQDIRLASKEQAQALIGQAVRAHLSVGAALPCAFRGPGYCFNRQILDALNTQSVTLNFSYNPSRDTQPALFGIQKQFRWSNGVCEVPVSCVSGFRNLARIVDFNFNSSALSTHQRMLEFLDRFFVQRGEDAIAVMVMHSWSFQYPPENDHFPAPHNALKEKFAQFLANLPHDVQIVTATEIAQDFREGNLQLSNMQPVSQVDATI
jgi:hypothetical protein